MSESKLKVFVSSTIEDFRDLRSALKFWLEEMGLEVRMSEHNDFERDPSQDTIDSCLAAIDPCQYYVLLVGSRKGYEDKKNPGLTITRMEFLHALELARQGEIVPIVFIRDEVLTALRERKEIRNAFPNVEELDSAPSRHMEDPAFTTSFIEEIRSSTLPGTHEDQPGFLWSYHFKGFGDLIDALRVTLPLRRNLRRQAMLANLKWELEHNIAKLSSKRGDLPFPATWWLSSVRREVSVDSHEILSPIALSRSQAESLLSLWMFGLSAAEKLSTIALLEAIQSGDFLIYDQPQQRLIPSIELKGMYHLADEIERLRLIVQTLKQEPLSAERNNLGANIMARRRHHELSTFAIVALFAAHDAVENVLRMMTSLYLWASDQTNNFVWPELNPTTPLESSIEGIREEQVTHEDLDKWMKNAYVRDQFTGLKTATHQDLYEAIQTFPEIENAFQSVQKRVQETLEASYEEFEAMRESEGEDAAFEWLMAQAKKTIASDGTP